MQIKIKNLLLLLVSILLISCSLKKQQLPQLPTKTNIHQQWQSHKHLVEKITSYKTKGTFAYISPSQKLFARFNWQKISNDEYRLIFLNFIGQKNMDLHIRPGLVHMIDNNGKSFYSKDTVGMIKKFFGIFIPFNEISYWILGLPGQSNNFIVNQRGYIHKINYYNNNKNWIVSYPLYHDDIEPALPADLAIHQGENIIKFKIDHWSF
ncbi:lipoprotein insertase outer membrane protein LolB [Candidatus Palibaumannia cicadellinicola]|uniref:Outer-membrane lipoprotein LolB n=1 Tax=Candidatus Palibaumannia cicadellinicola TaxID=186490 RepID=A0A0K2BKW1_9GAMM|nr:lipoprotein insertase outer membrane protein LolB [Candidatus Baumannia cicadellinicola]AKZ65839.1 Outer membrane lipoprotein [Candidatus Baumannia cicadellinicola]